MKSTDKHCAGTFEAPSVWSVAENNNIRQGNHAAYTAANIRRRRNRANHSHINTLQFVGRYMVLPGLVAYVLMNYIVIHGVVISGSMAPTSMAGDVYFGVRLVDKDNLQRGDLVLFFVEDGSVFYKRIIGIPGDDIAFSPDGYVLINNTPLDESEYLPEGTLTFAPNRTTYSVPEGTYFVMGDNRGNSLDSRYWSYPFVDADDVVGIPLVAGRLPVISDVLAWLCELNR